ncbi:hypothetical protein [Streptomyces sp. NBC_01198]|uniref:hypothetical protein n=1 Tax=Streptomyces sp. NBC_01198 TaxID=2903769 RepID=UPI002E116D37|nr:hypothetical protein OG702_32275 [Streptomyces sp. NBC_01198]
MGTKTVEWRPCECGIKRGFGSRRDAEKALGRAKAKRTRRADAHGTRRGLEIENRHYRCDYGFFHLTKESRKSFEERQAVSA